MPQEPDRKIEELLKAYAKKRHEDAGAPLEMHPATRKLLQAEAARLRPKPAAGSASWFQLLMQFWPRLGFAISIVIAVGLLFWTLHPKKEQSTEFAQAPAEAPPESADPLFEKDVTLKREAADPSSTPKPDASAVDRPQQPLDQAEPLRAQERLAAGESERQKAFDSERKLKEPAAKAGSQIAQRDDNGRIDLYAAPTTPAPNVPPGTPALSSLSVDTVAPALQPIEVARNPSGSVQVGGSFGGGVAQNRPDGNLKNNSPRGESKAAASLGALLSPVPTNTILAFSANGPDAVDSGAKYAFQKSPGTNALAYYYDSLQTVLPAGIPTNSTNTTLFAANGDSAGARFHLQQQNKLVDDISTKESERLREVRAGEALTVSLGKTTEDLKKLPETVKATTDRFGVNKDLDGLTDQSRSLERQSTTWKFVAEEQLADNEKELADVRLRTEADERLRRFRMAQPAVAGKPLVNSSLLTSFQVDLNGDGIRLTDADGSVYEGKLAVSKDKLGRKAPNVRSDSGVTTLEDLEKKQSTPEGAKVTNTADAAPVSFRASGTNRTLKQLVVIDATLSSAALARTESASRGLSAPFNEAASNTPAPPASAPAPITRPADSASVASVKSSEPARTAGGRSVLPVGARIQGKARIGATNEVNINALRVAP